MFKIIFKVLQFAMFLHKYGKYLYLKKLFKIDVV